MARRWNRTQEILPEEGKVILTRIHDIGGERNLQKLKRQGRLWFTSDGAMYVYYTPTHWSDEVEDA